MSKIDDQLAHSVYCGVWEAHHNDDGELQSGPCSCDLEAARTELAALRRRAEDAEAMLRWMCRPYVNSYGGKNSRGMTYCNAFNWTPETVSMWVDTNDGTSLSGGRQEMCVVRLKIDPDTRLPILTDKAREALK